MTLSRARQLRIVLLAALPAAACAQTPSEFSGSAVCRACHPDVWRDFFRNPHFRSIASGKEPPDKTGCEGCHGPGAAHVAAHGGKQTIRAFSELDLQQIMAACLQCHAKDLRRANIRSSEHTRAGVVCTNCHSIHHSTTARFLLASAQPATRAGVVRDQASAQPATRAGAHSLVSAGVAQAQLCYTCHPAIRAQFEMPARHRVNEGAMTCSDCHNPHGAFPASWRMGSESNMLEAAHDTEQPCLRCHVDKRGPFVFEHASVRVEGCSACHLAHGSTNARLLRRPAVFTMCLECHNGAGTFGRENTSVIATSNSHNLLDPRYQRCTLCHVRIHGSNSDPMFLR